MLARLSTANRRLAGFLDRRVPSPAGTSTMEQLERERGRIARELHAGAGQPLAGIKLHLELMSREAVLPDRLRSSVGRLQSLADAALEQVRAVSHRLNPPEWQQLSLRAAIENLVGNCGIEAITDFSEFFAEPSYGVRSALYRCVQESIANVIRHAGATKIWVALRTRNGWVDLSVSDNGSGFTERRSGHGMGLSAIRHHAAALEGTCEISSSLEGTTISIRVPAGEE